MFKNALNGLNSLSTTEMKTIIDVLYDEYKSLDTFLSGTGEISFQISNQNNYKKSLLLAAASYFETLVTQALMEYCDEVSNPKETITSFLKNKGLKRQYHTFFNWEDSKKGANTFFGLLGPTFSKYIGDIIKKDEKLTKGIVAFLVIGNERNRLVHINFATYTIEKTIEEIYALYEEALYFVANLKEYLHLRINPSEIDPSR